MTRHRAAAPLRSGLRSFPQFSTLTLALLLGLSVAATTAFAQDSDAPSTTLEKESTSADSKESIASDTEEIDSPAAASSAPDASVEEIFVTGTSVADSIDQARFSDSIVDVLSAEDFATTGDSGVVDALSRVTGVTTVGDKYVYVRGLGERYSSTLFNMALLPSPDPVRRVVPLDLFPAGVMQDLSVQKTWSPSLPADFAGGSVQLNTRDVPNQQEARLSLTTGYRTDTTGRATTWYEGSGSDWTGYDGSYRHLPSNIDELNTSSETRKELGLAMNRAFDTENKTLAPDFRLKGNWGNSYKLPIGKLGFSVGGQADNRWQYIREQRAVSSIDPDDPIFQTSDERRTTNTILYSGLGEVDWVPKSGHDVKATLFYTHLADKRYIQQDRAGGENDEEDQVIRSEWEEQQLLTAQLRGTHSFDSLLDLGVDWGATWSQATRGAPDSRMYLYEKNPTTGDLTFSNDLSNERTWEYLTDDAWDLFFDTQLPLKLTDQISTTLHVGTRYFLKQRESELRRFRYITTKPASSYENLPINEIFADENIGPPGGWQLREFTSPTDKYEAEEETIAGFIQTETELGSKVRWMLGTRYETTTQEITTPGLPEGLRTTSLDNAGFRPGTELTYLIRDDLQLRGGFSQTVNRPDLRELAPQIYLNPSDRFLYFGNPNLKVAELLNYDLRLEWYHDGPDNVSVAAFYKDLTDPIEQILRPSGNLRTFENAQSASIYGVEVAFRQSLAPLGRWADEFYVRSNGAWIQSEAESSPDSTATNKKHSLQGQSDWVANAQITWEKLPWEMQTTLALNMQGERISDLGTNGIDDAYEQPAPSLDFTLQKGLFFLGQELDLTFKARNLINPQFEVVRNGVAERSYRTGSTFSIEIGKDF